MDVIKNNNINSLKDTLKNPIIKPNIDNNIGIIRASINGYIDIVQELLK